MLSVHTLLCSFLPYHGTAEFVRMVQICALDGTVWKFLSKMQETGSILPRTGLVKVCTKHKVGVSAVLYVLSVY